RAISVSSWCCSGSSRTCALWHLVPTCGCYTTGYTTIASHDQSVEEAAGRRREQPHVGEAGGAGERLPAAVRERVGERRPSSRPDVGGADLDAEQVPGGAEEDVLAVGVAQVGRFADDRGGVGRADVERVVGAGRDVVRADLAAEPGQRGGDVDHVVDVD